MQKIIKFLLIILLTTSCSSKPKKVENITIFQGTAMTIPYRIIVGKHINKQRRQGVQALIDMTFAEVDQIYNKFNPNSELSKLNGIDAYVAEPISAELQSAFKATDEIVSLSEGKFDPTVESVQQLWQEHLSVGCKPPREEVEIISASVGWNQLHIQNGLFWKERSDTHIDLGGIAKGLCVDLLTERLVDSGYADILVEWGGEMRAHGRHPDDRPWRIFISRLDSTDPSQAIDTIDLDNQAIATSGDYLQNWNVGGTVYTHIVDPKTCNPLTITRNSIASATVLAPTCTLADALATSAMLFSSSVEAQKWAQKITESNPEISFWFITREGIGAITD